MYPLLPDRWESKVLRVAMSGPDWERFEALVGELTTQQTPTQARAYGATISRLIHSVPAPRSEPGPLEWLDWERRKTIRLLRSAV